MARKIANFTIVTDGRDKGKVFKLTELPASQAEAWAMRALLALMSSGIDLPENIENSGMAGMAEIGIRAVEKLSFDVAKPLLDEMLTCVEIIPDPAKPQIVRKLIEEDIEEVMTRIELRAEVWKLHTDFLKAVVPSMLTRAKADRAADK